ncbi:hypothetical protein N9L47_06815 [Rhodobacteraceae bacterium]|nr:hypothetical protein [Paracoccaceae bacterium]
MEMQLVYLVLGGWFLMLFIGSVVPAFILAAAIGGAGGYLVFLDKAGGSDLIAVMQVAAPLFFAVTFVAWPIGAVLRLMLRRPMRRF